MSQLANMATNTSRRKQTVKLRTIFFLFGVPLMRARRVSPSLTLEDAIEIWRRHWLGEAQHVIVAAFGVNQGRISEVLAGQRFPETRKLALKGRVA